MRLSVSGLLNSPITIEGRNKNAMGKLDRIETVTIILTVWAAAFLGSLIYTQDWARSLGGSIWFLLLGWAVVGTLNKRRAKRIPT